MDSHALSRHEDAVFAQLVHCSARDKQEAASFRLCGWQRFCRVAAKLPAVTNWHGPHRRLLHAGRASGGKILTVDPSSYLAEASEVLEQPLLLAPGLVLLGLQQLQLVLPPLCLSLSLHHEA